ncbi:MAG: class I adenylate-forming enzyme family protein [Acidimicrobiales bacterium]
MAGGTIVLMRRWNPALKLIERERITNVSGVPTMSREHLAYEDWERRDTSSLAGLAGGGAPVPPDLVDKIGATPSKDAASTGYGLTETGGTITANTSACYQAKPASCGPVVPTLDASWSTRTASTFPRPGDGGPVVGARPGGGKGYFGQPDATAGAIIDGWFDTGDLARIDEDGFAFLVDRAKDMVLRGGEKVYCSEVEAAIYEHPGVAEAAVFALPDERLGEAVAAVVVPVDGAVIDLAELQAFVWRTHCPP